MFSKNFRKSYGFSLFKLFAGLILLFALIFTGGLIYYQTRQVSDGLVKEGKIIATLLAGNMKTWIYAENAEKLKDALKEPMRYPHIDSVTIYNAKGEIIYQEHKKVQPADAGVPDFSGMVFSKMDNSLFHVDAMPDVINITSPVTMVFPGYQDELLYFDRPESPEAETTIGYIRVGISKDTLAREVRQIMGRMAIAVVLGLFAGLVILIITIRRVTNPISQLTVYVNRLGSGEAVGLIPTPGKGEIGRLAEAFNSMSVNLTKREEEKGVLEARLRKARTLEAVGTLARGVAHDFNNILSTIQGSVYLIEKRFSDHKDLLRYSAEIQQSLAKAQGLITGLLTFSRTKTVAFHPVELNGLIVTLRPMLGNIMSSGVAMHFDLYPGPLNIMGDALQIEQVVMNLAYNARDAMPSGGSLTVGTSRAVISEDDTESAGLNPGPYALLSVIDTGDGMDEAIRQKIFEPFFTTKERGKGTGLGLAIVYGIIEQHQGSVELETAPGKGTAFHVWLPLTGTQSGETDIAQQDGK